jgi:hypothetical protein
LLCLGNGIADSETKSVVFSELDFHKRHGALLCVAKL